MVQSSKTKELAAYLFLTENSEDVNAEITQSDYDSYMHRANALIACVDSINQMIAASEKEMEAEIYEIGKRFYGTEKIVLRNFFKDLYMILFVKTQGPRLGVFISILGLDNFKSRLNERMSHPFIY